jgi:hypothetical protein
MQKASLVFVLAFIRQNRVGAVKNAAVSLSSFCWSLIGSTSISSPAQEIAKSKMIPASCKFLDRTGEDHVAVVPAVVEKQVQCKSGFFSALVGVLGRSSSVALVVSWRQRPTLVNLCFLQTRQQHECQESFFKLRYGS